MEQTINVINLSRKIIELEEFCVNKLCVGTECSECHTQEELKRRYEELDNMVNKYRLTESDDLGNWGVKGLRWKDLHEGEVITKEIHEKLYGCLAKLKDYEETELSPEEVEEFRRLKEKDTPKAAVITGHNNAINTDIGECPNCAGLPLRACDFKYCPECGQRLDWSGKNE